MRAIVRLWVMEMTPRLLFFVAALVSCTPAAAAQQQGHPSSGIAPARLMTFTPPPDYQRWWSKMEACASLTRDMQNVGFAVVGSPLFVFAGESGFRLRAAAFVAPDSIYIGLYSAGDSATVMHEMLHALRPGSDGEADGGHPRQDFEGPCAALIAHGDERKAKP